MSDGEDPASDRKARGIALLLERTARLVYDEKQPNALHPVQWSALRYLERAGEQSRNSAGIARYLGVTSGPASRTTSSLIKRGLVSSARSMTDSRARVLDLTEKGREMLREDPLNRCARIVIELDEEERTALAIALDKLYARLSESDSDE